MVANDEWIQIFLEAKLHHGSMSASDHCLLALFLKKNQYCKRGKKRFLFEVMWTREEECREVIKLVWDPYTEDSSQPIQERPERYQRQLQCWNQNSFGNVYKTLKQKQIHLQQLEFLNPLHKTAEEIQVVRKEINALHIREEIKWNRRSQVCWLQNRDKNTKFFHATVSPRQWKNRLGGLMNDWRMWHKE